MKTLKMNKSIACLNLDCAKLGRHVKGCIAYGSKYPKKLSKKFKGGGYIEYEQIDDGIIGITMNAKGFVNEFWNKNDKIKKSGW